MTTVLITAFEPYDRWGTNSSWLCLQELTRSLPESPKIVTRLYPVNFNSVRERLAADLQKNYDYALHLGQAPGATAVRLEAFGVNVGGEPSDSPDAFAPLAPDGPTAYRCPLPLGAWAAQLRAAGVPAAVSYHAGTYLCNATLYWSLHLATQMRLKTQSAFLHLPLDVSQTAAEGLDKPSLPAEISAQALRLILGWLAKPLHAGSDLPSV